MSWKQSVFSRSRTTSEKNLQIVEGDQYLVEVEQSDKNLQIVESGQYLVEKILSELVLLLPNTVSFEQFVDFVRACSTSTKYWLLSTIWRFFSELVLLLLNTDRFQQFENFCQRNCSKLSVFGRSRTSSDKNLQIVESNQYLVEVEPALTKIFKLLKAVSI
jgi:hypothetical protein